MPNEVRRPRYLIGNGEKLTSETGYRGGGGGKDKWPYSLVEATERLQPRLQRVVTAVNALPATACPDNQAVAMLTLHPEALAKTHFPSGLLAGVGLRAVGCRGRTIKPEKWSYTRKANQSLQERTIELYVAGPREKFQKLAQLLASNSGGPLGYEQLCRVEDFRPLSDLNAEGRIATDIPSSGVVALEAGVHITDSAEPGLTDAFLKFVSELGGEAFRNLVIQVPGVAFIPLRIARSALDRLSQFAFLRTVRSPARLRMLPAQALTRSVGTPFVLPVTAPLNPAIRVAVLDGGLPQNHGLPHTQHYPAPGVGAPHTAYSEHGTMVTGALLWGVLNDLEHTPTPVASVDHFRVLDTADTGSDDFHAYRVLRRVQDVIEAGPHDIFNLSLGPDIPCDDGEVHPWTSTLDTLAADGTRLIVAAAGNNGHLPGPLDRIQVPGDGVNCLCVGSADSQLALWGRAEFSPKGPGRRPGVTKPDLVAYGGSGREPLKVILQKGSGYVLTDQMGTSFSAILTTRSAAALRSFFSANLHPLTLKALLIHTAVQDGNHVAEVGWGRIIPITDLVECPPATARVIYQGELPPKGILRVPIPVPQDIRAPLDITATLCFASEVRASDPLNYTNSGVEIRFRPHSERFRIDQEDGEETESLETDPFFSDGHASTEGERRVRGQKWETVMHATKRITDMNELLNPVFDLHLVPRIGGKDDDTPKRVRYSLVVSVAAPAHPDLYEKVLKEFPRLQALTPVVVSTNVRI